MWLFHYVVTNGSKQFHDAHMDKVAFGTIPKESDIETVEDHITLQRANQGYSGHVRIVSFSKMGRES